MPTHDIIVIGASAGGVEAISLLVAQLPPDLPASLFVVMHFPAQSNSILPQILNRYNTLPAHHAKDREPIQPGQIYVTPPDRHLLLQPGYINLSRGPREHGHRPSVDTLFRSAAGVYRSRVVGVILSGTLDDGSAGIIVIKDRGGVAIVQDPDEALFNGMPHSAIQAVKVDFVLPVAGIAAQLVQFAHQAVEEMEMPPDETPDTYHAPAIHHEIEQESKIIGTDKATRERGEHPGDPSILTCPDCGGVLWELQEDNIIRFRCHVGHAYSIESLLAEQADDVERALWSAVRALEEKASLARRMATRASQQKLAKSAAQFSERAEEAKQNADLVRQMILQQPDLKNGKKKLSGDR